MKGLNFKFLICYFVGLAISVFIMMVSRYPNMGWNVNFTPTQIVIALIAYTAPYVYYRFKA